VLACVTGIVAAYSLTPAWLASGLFGLLVSMLAYGAYYGLARVLGVKPGYSAVAEEPSSS
jgi:hypothetical protein